MRLADLPIDRHVHTRWSLDIPHGPNFEDYCVHLEEAQIRVGFLDHYELLYQEESRNPMGEDRFAKYLEQIDAVKSNWGKWVEFGLEVDYYPHPGRITRLREFMDDHHGTFDFFVGTLHEGMPNCLPVTDHSYVYGVVPARKRVIHDKVGSLTRSGGVDLSVRGRHKRGDCAFAGWNDRAISLFP